MRKLLRNQGGLLRESRIHVYLRIQSRKFFIIMKHITSFTQTVQDRFCFELPRGRETVRAVIQLHLERRIYTF
jgi:hypothetical protein